MVDTGPDFRTQCLREDIRHLDAVLLTHPHMDHLTGFDELRRFTIAEEATMPVYARPSCLEVVERMFFYAFNGENRYRGYLKPDPRPIHGVFQLGDTSVTPLPLVHGKVETIGFLFERAGRRLVLAPAGERLLAQARRLLAGKKDAELLDEALRELVRTNREAEIDAAYARAYAEHPIDEPDEWGDLDSFRRAIGRARS